MTTTLQWNNGDAITFTYNTNSGNQNITISSAKNYTYSARTKTVTFRDSQNKVSKTLKITQNRSSYSFNIYGSGVNVKLDYCRDDNMTWQQWYNSGYNQGTKLTFTAGRYVYVYNGVYYSVRNNDNNQTEVIPTDIISSSSYLLKQIGT